MALADRGALTIDAGGGGVATLLPAPTPVGFAATAPVTPTTAAVAVVGARYALSNAVELAISGFFQPSIAIFHNGVTLTSVDATPFPGTLSHQYRGYGGAVGARYLWGSEWRLTAGVQLGWARRLYSGLQQVNDRVSPAVDYRLGLADFAIDSVLFAAGGGIEWVFADTMSVSLLARLEFIPGRALAVAVMLPVQISFSFYL
jgi:hypothetical protein